MREKQKQDIYKKHNKKTTRNETINKTKHTQKATNKKQIKNIKLQNNQTI